MKLKTVMYVPCYKGEPIYNARTYAQDAWHECRMHKWDLNATNAQLRKLGYSVEKYDLVKRKKV